MKRTTLCCLILAAVSLCGCPRPPPADPDAGLVEAVDAGVEADAGPEPVYPGPEQITITRMDADSGIAGTTNGVPFTLDSVGGNPTARRARFGLDGGASMVTEDTGGGRVFTAGQVTWSIKFDLTAADRAALKVFAGSPEGKALVNTAAFLYFKNDSVELMPYRVSAIELYNQLSEFYADADKLVHQPPGTLLPGCPVNPCLLRTNDAIFNCSYPTGQHYDVVMLQGGLPDDCQVVGYERIRSHDPGDCYGACGRKCRFCKSVTARCTSKEVSWSVDPPVDGTEGTSLPTACFVQPSGKFFPDDLTLDQSVCQTPESYPAATPLSDPHYYLCASREECFRHDECLGHDSFGTDAWVRCNTEAANAVGVAAAWGRPKETFVYKWFLSNGMPMYVGNSSARTDRLGTCGWRNGCDGGQCSAVGTAMTNIPAAIDPELDHAPCLVHRCKHTGAQTHCACTTDAECRGGLEEPRETSCVNGQCACVPRNCAQLGLDCGSGPDGCGGTAVCSTPCQHYSGTSVFTFVTNVCNPADPRVPVPGPARPTEMTLRKDGTQATVTITTENRWPTEFRFNLSPPGGVRGSTVPGDQPHDLEGRIGPDGHLRGRIISSDPPRGCHEYVLDLVMKP